MQNKLIDELIKEELKKTGGNVSKAARSLGLPYHTLVLRYGPRANAVLPPVTIPRPDDIRLLGKPGLEPFVIAIKRAGHGWSDEFNDALRDARRRYDAGTHEMVQTANGGWVVQYLIPRRRPTSRRNFFSAIR